MSRLIDGRAHGYGAAASAKPSQTRLLWPDLVRTLALVGMIVFHFSNNLELFGVLQTGTTRSSGWAISARLIAGSFLLLSGLSLLYLDFAILPPSATLAEVVDGAVYGV